MSWQAVSTLANGYQMSLETVAIRYVKFHPDPCALLVCDLEESKAAQSRVENAVKIRYAIYSFTFPLCIFQDSIVVHPYPLLSSSRLSSGLMPTVRTMSVPGHQLGFDTGKELIVEARLIKNPKVSIYILVWPG